MDFYKLKPRVVEKIWGGNKLNTWRNLENENLIGETLEVSRLKGNSSFTLDGKFLSDLIPDDELPFLIKYIDTTDNLSVQVHPDDDYAMKKENSLGKTECWLILSADKGAGIYLGLKDSVTKEKLKTEIKSNGPVHELLNFYPVSKGDFFFVPAGTIHAIGKGITLVEVQQSCGITYRVWDWNRVDSNGKSRELHVENALDVIEFSREMNSKEFFRFKENVFSDKAVDLASHKDFIATIYNLDELSNCEHHLKKNHSRFTALTVLEGAITIEVNDKKVDLLEKNSLILKPNSQAKVLLTSKADKCSVLVVD